ncbi:MULTISPECIES: ESPR-type extended signal peptide-containing protein [Pasteurellaceae]|nr:ESPR domain-containing protein [Pasteurella atlantica]QVE19853.1 ESPR domain-containing protein [Pasteurella atlantica]
MNKHCYRVIFSKTLNQLVMMFELSQSEGRHFGGSSKFANFFISFARALG